MRYFTRELWEKINHPQESERKQAEVEWLQSMKQYQKDFEKVKKHLPHQFTRQYLNRNEFHDYIITDIVITSKHGKYACRLQLTDRNDTLYLTMFDLKSFKINIETFQNCIQGELTWGFSEFEYTAAKCVRLSILCDIQNELQFDFKALKLTNASSKTA